jgi:hypothetical protein
MTAETAKRVESAVRDALGAASDDVSQFRDRPGRPGLLTRILVSDLLESAEDAAILLRECRVAKVALGEYLGHLADLDAKYAPPGRTEEASS